MPNRIKVFFHCRRCLKMKPSDKSAEEWARLNVGWTEKGLQVWCVRCNENVVSLDFMGQKVRHAEEDLAFQTRGSA